MRANLWHLRFAMSLLLLALATALTSCGAGYGPGCAGREGKTPYCTFRAP